jgi:hypothetical protein
MTYPLDVLTAFSARRATPRETVAALIAHDAWLVPMSWALADPRRTRFDTLYLAEPATVPDDELWLYTNPGELAEARGKLASRHNLGCYAGPVSGVELFENLPDTIHRLEINPGLPTERCFFAKGRALVQIRELARTFGLEHALEQRADDVIERLLAFPVYQLLVEDGAPRHALATPQLKRPLTVFTSREACAITARRQELANPATEVLTGRALFPLVEAAGADGVALIASDGGATYELDRSTCDLLVQLAARLG